MNSMLYSPIIELNRKLNKNLPECRAQAQETTTTTKMIITILIKNKPRFILQRHQEAYRL